MKEHDDVIKRKHFPRYWPFVRGIHRSPVNSPHNGQWRGALMFSLICVWINGWVNNGEADDLRCYRTHYDITVMCQHHLSVQEIANIMFCFLKWFQHRRSSYRKLYCISHCHVCNFFIFCSLHQFGNLEMKNAKPSKLLQVYWYQEILFVRSNMHLCSGML